MILGGRPLSPEKTNGFYSRSCGPLSWGASTVPREQSPLSPANEKTAVTSTERTSGRQKLGLNYPETLRKTTNGVVGDVHCLPITTSGPLPVRVRPNGPTFALLLEHRADSHKGLRKCPPARSVTHVQKTCGDPSKHDLVSSLPSSCRWRLQNELINGVPHVHPAALGDSDRCAVRTIDLCIEHD